MSTTRRDNAQPTDVPVPPPGGRPADASQFRGPHFLCNMEGLVLRLLSNRVLASRFKGDRTQEWLLQPDPDGTGKVAIASLDNGMYLALRDEKYRAQARKLSFRDKPTVQKSPFYWEIVSTQGLYSLSAGEDKLALPLSPSACELRQIVSTTEEQKSARLLILENTLEIQEALEIGKIGRWAYPDQSVYHTIGEVGLVQIYNHLDAAINVAISDRELNLDFGGMQVRPGLCQSWMRGLDQNVHVSLGDCIGAQTAEVFQCPVGKVLHIQSLPSKTEWEGMKSVLPNDARYTVNEADKELRIGVENNLQFNIYVLVLRSTKGIEGSQHTIRPGEANFWLREGPEIVLVSVGGAFGAPRAFLGKVGFTLQIDRL